jgi:protein-disulfide isomerase
MRRARWVLALGVLACDEPEVDVVGLERKVELLEQQQRESEEVRSELAKQVQEDVAARAELQAKMDATEASLASLQSRIDGLEAAAEKRLEPARPAVAGRPVSGERYKVDLGDAQTRGNAEARVTIVMFSDFQCPFCSRAMTTIRELEKHYGKDLRFAMKHNALPMHTNARPAAIAAEAAGKQGKFWEMHDKLYENPRELTRDNFVTWAKDLKLDKKRFEGDLDAAALGDKVDAHQEQARKLGANGTPSFFINGRYLSGAQPADAFKKIIDEELAEADKLLASGTPAASVYERAIASGKEKPD